MTANLTAVPKAGTGEILTPMTQASGELPVQGRHDPGPIYWASAAATACAVAAPFPFFWAPPLWVGLLLAPPPLPALAVLGTVLQSLEIKERKTTNN